MFINILSPSIALVVSGKGCDRLNVRPPNKPFFSPRERSRRLTQVTEHKEKKVYKETKLQKRSTRGLIITMALLLLTIHCVVCI